MNYQEKAKELRRISGHTRADEFVEEGDLALEVFLIASKTSSDFSWALGHVFQAGKIEGIRNERAKRKEKLAKAKKEEETVYTLTSDERINLISKYYNIEYSLSQIASITNSVGDALYSGNDGTDYAPALNLASTELKRQQKQIQKLTDFILKEIAKKINSLPYPYTLI